MGNGSLRVPSFCLLLRTTCDGNVSAKSLASFVNSESGEAALARIRICAQDCNHSTDSRNRAAPGNPELEADLVNADSALKELAFTTYVGALLAKCLHTAARSVSRNQHPRNGQNHPTIYLKVSLYASENCRPKHTLPNQLYGHNANGAAATATLRQDGFWRCSGVGIFQVTASER